MKKKPLTPAQIRSKSPARGADRGEGSPSKPRYKKPPLPLFATTLWEYPSQHHDRDDAPGKSYVGATPSWVVWQLLQRYTREGDLVIDPFAGSGTTIDIALSESRRALGYDLNPDSQRDGLIFRADARSLPLEDETADFVFMDPPYSTHVDYTDDPRCIGRLDAGMPNDRGEIGADYYAAMDRAFAEAHRVLKDRRYLAIYVSDSFKKRSPNSPGVEFMPIGFELFALLRNRFKPVDVIAVVRHNRKLQQGNWKKAAIEQNFFLRGFNYCLIFKKEDAKPKSPKGQALMPALDAILAGRRALLVVAVDAEANAIRRGLGLPEDSHTPWSRTELTERLDLAVTGVGKSNAAGATARALEPIRHACAINLGIAGALPRDGADPLTLASLIAASRSTLADEGMLAPSGFQSLAQMGFAPIPAPGADGMSVPAHAPLLDALAPLADATGPIATVSTCAANDALARDVASRTGALAEAMEGAAIGTVALALNIPFLEVRAISNTTGDRERQTWNIRTALDALARLASSL